MNKAGYIELLNFLKYTKFLCITNKPTVKNLHTFNKFFTHHKRNSRIDSHSLCGLFNSNS